MKHLRFIFILLCISSCHPKWRVDYSDAFLKLPPIRILLQDSISAWDSQQLPADRPLVILYFSPDCVHCADMTSYLMDSLRLLQGATLLFVSNAPLEDIRRFSQSYHIDAHQNMIIGNDQQYNVFNIYKINAFPEIIIYNRQRKLAKLYKGEIDIQQILHAINS